MSFQIFAISERSKVWKQIAGKILKVFESKSLENFWKLFESSRAGKRNFNAKHLYNPAS